MINDRGTLLGYRMVDGTPHVFLYRETYKDLDLIAYPVGINNRQEIAGKYRVDAQCAVPHGFLWTDGVMTDLGDFIPAAINDAGQIAGTILNRPAIWDGARQPFCLSRATLGSSSLT